jgi:hypothetical protein
MPPPRGRPHKKPARIHGARTRSPPVYDNAAIVRHVSCDRDTTDAGQDERHRDLRDPATIRLGGDESPQLFRLALSGLSGRLPDRPAKPDSQAERRNAVGRQVNPDRRSAASHCSLSMIGYCSLNDLSSSRSASASPESNSFTKQDSDLLRNERIELARCTAGSSVAITRAATMGRRIQIRGTPVDPRGVRGLDSVQYTRTLLGMNRRHTVKTARANRLPQSQDAVVPRPPPLQRRESCGQVGPHQRVARKPLAAIQDGTSASVVDEARSGDRSHSSLRLATLKGTDVLTLSPRWNSFVPNFCGGLNPTGAGVDPFHVALASAYQVDFVLTWN